MLSVAVVWFFVFKVPFCSFQTLMWFKSYKTEETSLVDLLHISQLVVHKQIYIFTILLLKHHLIDRPSSGRIPHIETQH